jgi:MFS transporter, ACS family, glucarate transporter
MIFCTDKSDPMGQREPSIVVGPGNSATRVRYAVVSVAAMAAALLYLDRVCIAFAGTYIREELGLTPVQMGWVLGAFFWAYALGQVPAGWLGDRFGGRRMMTVYILAWSLFTATTAAASGLAWLIVARLAFGMAQAGAYPTATSLLSRWVPTGRRGAASSLVSLGGRFGGAAAPLLTAVLLVAFVPVTHSSRLAAGDIIDPAKLRHSLIDPNGPAASELARHVLQNWSGPRPSPDAGPQIVDGAGFATGLNRALSERALVDGVPIPLNNLPREALALVHKSVTDRTTFEVERLNRLVLEAVFPGTIRRINGDGWRPLLVLYGVSGLAVATVYWVIARDSPSRHPWCNVAEIQLIEEGVDSSGRTTAVPPASPPWRLLLRSRDLGLMSFSEFAVNLGWAFVVTLLPDYLSETFAVPIEERGTMASVPLLVGSLGMLGGGWLTDFLTRRLGLRWGRAAPNSLSKIISATAFLACLWLPSAWGVVAAMAVMAVATDLAVPTVWAFSQDIGGRHAGAALGWSNMWGNFGAALSPVVLAAAREAGGWSLAFLTAAVSFMLASVAAALVDARKPIEPVANSPR